MNLKYKDLIVFIIFIMLMVLIGIIFPSRNNKNLIDELKHKNIKSIIYRKSIYYENHGIPYIVYGKFDSLIIYRDWESKIEIGDSIIKPKGSTTLIIKNLKKIEYLDYTNQDLRLPNPQTQ